LNFFEWMFIRRCGVAWGQSNSRQMFVTKNELLDMGMIIMLPYIMH